MGGWGKGQGGARRNAIGLMGLRDVTQSMIGEN